MPSTQDIRQNMRKQRAKISKNDQAIAAIQLQQHITKTPIYQQSQHIACYWAVGGEISLQPLIQKIWQTGKTCYLPILTGETMAFAQYQEDTPLKNNRFGIPEPANSPSIPATSLELVLTPLLAFDKLGHRIGMGGGFYDKTFAFKKRATTRPFLMGAAHHCQQVCSIQANAWDVDMDQVLTDAGSPV